MTNWITEIEENDSISRRASGIIANKMAAQSISEVGFRKLHYPRIYASKLEEMGKEVRTEYLEALLSCVSPGDTVIVQYPLWTNSPTFELEFINYLKLVRQAKIVAMVWDIISWVNDGRDRDYKGDASLWMLNKYDLVIAANPKMAKRLHEEGGVTRPMISMYLTDILYSGPLKLKQFKKEFYYVSSGIDPAMIKEYPTTMPINFIGPYGNMKNIPAYFRMLGSMDTNDIPYQFDGGFGLLYYPKDGAYKGMSRYGEYNNPMKLSLYLGSGLPVVILSNSAHAKWIKAQGVGVVINGLEEIGEVIDNISQEDYDQMLENIRPWQRAISTGFFAKNAALEAIRYINLGFKECLVDLGEDND